MISNLTTNKIIASSGALGTNGCGWHPLQWMLLPYVTPTTKTVTIDPQKGRSFWQAKKNIKGGCVNALGLDNKGLIRTMVYDWQHWQPQPRIVSLYAASPVSAYRIADLLSWETSLINHDKIIAYEINISCGNVQIVQDVMEVLRIFSTIYPAHPIILKIGYDQTLDALAAAERGYIQGVHAINSIRWESVFPGAISPLFNKLGVAGTVSGDPIRETALKIVERLRKQLPANFPIIGGGGVSTPEHTQQFLNAGATYVAMGSALLNPLKTLPVVRKFVTTQNLDSPLDNQTKA